MNEIKLKIGIFGDKGVGKTTFLTILHGALMNRLFEEIKIRYANSDTVIYLKENFRELQEGQVPSTVGEHNIDFDLFYTLDGKEQKFRVEMKDFPGERFQTQNNKIDILVDFLSKCDGILLFHSIFDKSKDANGQNIADLNLILSKLIEKEKDAEKIRKPFVLILTKSDEFLKGAEHDTLEDLNKITRQNIERETKTLVSVLSDFVENFKIVPVSSHIILEHFKRFKDKSIALHKDSGSRLEFSNIDVTYPITFILKQKLRENNNKDFFGNILKYFSSFIVLLGFFFYFFSLKSGML